MKFILSFFLCFQSFAQMGYFNGASLEKPIEVNDKISKNPINTKIFVVYKNSKVTGFYRKIYTTTGCNSACLPLSYTSYYDASGNLLEIKSKDGLTKINHTPFTSEDYARLNFLLSLAPREFSKVKHPKEMTDAISGATLKNFKDIVVTGAAYSTLRIHLYNQDSLLEIKNFLKK